MTHNKKNDAYYNDNISRKGGSTLRERRLNRKTAKKESLLEDLKQLTSEENEKKKEKLQSKVEKLERQIAKAAEKKAKSEE